MKRTAVARRLVGAFSLLVLSGLSGLSGCAEMLGNLRKDLNDQEPQTAPTVGGIWPEGNLLDQGNYAGPYSGPYASVGHNDPRMTAERALSESEAGWISEAQREANARDGYRGGGTAFSNTPNVAPPIARNYRAKRDDFIDSSQSSGSLWASDGQTNYYFTKNRIRDVGDVITMEMQPDFIRDVSSEMKKTLTPNEREVELYVAQERLKADAGKNQKSGGAARAPASGAKPGAAGAKDAAPESDVREATYADIDVTPETGLKEKEPMMLEIVERYPNGHVKVRGTKRLPYRGTLRTVAMVGVAKASDIDDKDLISSGKLYEYRLNVFR